jgi:outer membrane protein
MRTKLYTWLALLIIGKSFAQSAGSTTEFSLQAAIDYSLKHSASYLNAQADEKSASYKKNEILGVGLPQINGSFDLKYYAKVPTVVAPFGPGGSLLAIQFGIPYSATPSLTASQLIFSSDYIVGVQAAKHVIALSEKNTLRTKAETVQNVSKAYYMVLVNKERVKLLDANLTRLKKLLDDTKAYNKEGFVEKIDVDRLEVTYNNLLIEKEKTDRLIGLSETLLKFQMGYKLSDPITLTDKLDAEQQNAATPAADSKINYSNRPEYSLLETQRKLNELEIRRYRMGYLPSLVGYANLGYNAFNTKFEFLEKSQNWYPVALVGATLNVPIFDGLQKHWKIQQSKVSLLKTTNTLQNLELAIELETTSANIALQNAISSTETQKKNMELAQNVFDVSEKKYQQGVGSNIEMVNAQTSLKEAQTNYYQSLYDLLVAKTDYLKATGNLVK